MDDRRFDTLVRSIEAAVPRRNTLAAALAAALLALTARLDEHAVTARKRKKKKCKGNKRKCGKKCVPKTQCCSDGECPTGAQCLNGTCVCPVGTSNCGDVCADLATDGANCGACGVACSTGDCVHGACTCTGLEDCPNGCTACVPRAEGGSACSAVIDDPQTCESDDDCPLGSFCIDVGPVDACSGACPA